MAPHSATNGTNGVHNPNGTHTTNGRHSTNSINGANGTNGINGTNGYHHDTHNSSLNSKTQTRMAPPGPPAPLATAQHHPVLKADREGITTALSQFGQLIHAPRRPLPTQNGDSTASVRRTQTGLRTDMKFIGWKDIKTLVNLIKSKIHGSEPMDDHAMLMERIIQLVAGLPTKSRTRVLLTDQFINELWYSLDHPVLNFIGEKYMYRSADGSNNNPLFPQVGAAGTTYARSVRPTIMPPGALPDPGLIFDSVMRRSSSGYKKHPNNVSSILWYWATIIIHDLFWTDYRDMNKSKTSSYLDLSPLYGSNQDMQDTIRTFRDGKLKPDAYADKRLNGMPPGVSVLLIMFNRFHNHVAEHLAAINEGGRFTPPPGPRPGLSNPQFAGDSKEQDEAERRSDDAWKKYDEDLFQTARLVTSGLYINITLVDYVRNIVNLNRCDTTWTLDPRQEMGRDAGTAAGAESGTGNVVSAEFNLCYRWHSCISEKDDKWIQDFYVDLFGKPATEVGVQDMVMGFMKFDKSIPEDPGMRVFGNFARDPKTGKFSDDDLADCIASAIEDCAGSFGARNVPISMRPVEILGILQGRKWHVAGLNEFRRHFGLKPYDTFEELNSDPEVASCLRHLYEHPDFVELYPGLVAEEAKAPMVPGVGIAPTYTISRVVLSDAVCLVRGDRHYTTDYSPRALTNWGYNEVQYDLNVNHGCVFYKLFLRAFPGHFAHNSVYAHYPMVTPAENRRILTALKRAELFTWDRPGPGGSRPRCAEVRTHGGARQVLDHRADRFRSVWNESFAALMGRGRGRQPSNEQRLSGDGWEGTVKAFYVDVMERLFREKSYILGGSRHVDVVRDVGNLANVHFVSRLFNLPLKTSANPKGIYTEDELYAVLTLTYVTIFLDVDPVKSFPLRQATKTVAEQLSKLIETSVGGSNGWFGGGEKNDPLSRHGTNLIKSLLKSGLSTADIASDQVMPTVVATVPVQSTALAQAVDFYLSPAGEPHLAKIQKLARQSPSKQTDVQLFGYAMEAVRLTGMSASREACGSETIVEDDGRRVSVRAGDRVFVNLVTKPSGNVQDHDDDDDDDDDDGHDLSSTTDTAVDPDRPLESHLYPGLGPHSLLGREVFQIALTETFRAVFRKTNLRRTPGPQGELKRIETGGGGGGGGGGMYLTEDWSSTSPLPTSMRVCWDGR